MYKTDKALEELLAIHAKIAALPPDEKAKMAAEYPELVEISDKLEAMKKRLADRKERRAKEAQKSQK